MEGRVILKRIIPAKQPPIRQSPDLKFTPKFKIDVKQAMKIVIHVVFHSEVGLGIR